MKKLLIAGVLGLLPLCTAYADVNGFVGGGGSGAKVRIVIGDFEGKAQPENIFGRAGISVNDYFDLGVEISRSVSSGQFGGGSNLDADTTFLYGRIKLPVGERANCTLCWAGQRRNLG